MNHWSSPSTKSNLDRQGTVNGMENLRANESSKRPVTGTDGIPSMLISRPQENRRGRTLVENLCSRL